MFIVSGIKSSLESLAGNKHVATYTSRLSGPIRDELRYRNLYRFVVQKESDDSSIVIEIYENCKWHQFMKNWGSVVGVYLNPVFDRAQYTDETGQFVAR